MGGRRESVEVIGSASRATESGGKPPDGGGDPPKKISSQDKILSGNSLPKQPLPEGLLSNNLAKIESHEGDKLRPRISYDKFVIEAISIPWRDALVIKLVGRNLGYSIIKERIRSLWRLQGGYEILSAGFGYYMVKFDCLDDREKVMVGGPWMINGCYLTVK